jgi:hypothetical protein
MIAALVSIVLLGTFWLRAAAILGLSAAKVTTISIVAVVGLSAFVALLLLAAAIAPVP